MTLTPFNKLAIPIRPFFIWHSLLQADWRTMKTHVCARFTELNAWTYIEVKKHQKAPTHKKLGVTIKTVVLIVFDITYFLSLSWMMVKMVKWVSSQELNDRVSEGNACEERSRDEEMMLQENNTTFQNQCEQKQNERKKMAWNVKDSRERVIQINRCSFDGQMVWFLVWFSSIPVPVFPGI